MYPIAFDSNEPVWIGQSTKQLIKERDSGFCKYQSQGRRDEDLHFVRAGVQLINFSMDNKKILIRQENIFRRSEKALEEREKCNIVRKTLVT